MKSKTSYLDNHKKREKSKWRSQKEIESASTFRKKERCKTYFCEQGKVYVWYHKDKIGMLSDADRVSCNERLYQRSYRNTWDPDEEENLVHLTGGYNTAEQGNLKETSSDAFTTAKCSISRYGTV